MGRSKIIEKNLDEPWSKTHSRGGGARGGGTRGAGCIEQDIALLGGKKMLDEESQSAVPLIPSACGGIEASAPDGSSVGMGQQKLDRCHMPALSGPAKGPGAMGQGVGQGEQKAGAVGVPMGGGLGQRIIDGGGVRALHEALDACAMPKPGNQNQRIDGIFRNRGNKRLDASKAPLIRGDHKRCREVMLLGACGNQEPDAFFMSVVRGQLKGSGYGWGAARVVAKSRRGRARGIVVARQSG